MKTKLSILLLIVSASIAHAVLIDLTPGGYVEGTNSDFDRATAEVTSALFFDSMSSQPYNLFGVIYPAGWVNQFGMLNGGTYFFCSIDKSGPVPNTTVAWDFTGTDFWLAGIYVFGDGLTNVYKLPYGDGFTGNGTVTINGVENIIEIAFYGRDPAHADETGHSLVLLMIALAIVLTMSACQRYKTQMIKKLLSIVSALVLFSTVGKADFMSTLDVGNDASGTSVGGFPGPFGVVNVALAGQTATITFTGSNGFQFGDGGSVAVQVNAASFTEAILTDGDFKQFSFAQNEDGFGQFNLIVDNNNFSTGFNVISFSVTNTSGTPWTSANDVLAFNTSGFDAAAHVRESINNGAGLTGFAAEDINGTPRSVPDNGNTAMLLGIAFVSLSGIRSRMLHH